MRTSASLGDSLEANSRHQLPISSAADWESETQDESTPMDGTTKWRETPSIWWLLPFILLFTLGFGGAAVPRINVTLALVCRDHLADKKLKDPSFSYPPVIPGQDNPQCHSADVQSLVARFNLYLSLTAGLLASWVSPRLGNLSDRYGRTRLIALNALGALLNEVILILVMSFATQVPTNLLFLGQALDGVGGSFTTAMALCQSYACDCTSFKTRGTAFGLFQGALFFGVAVGPSLAALLIKKTGNTVLVFYITVVFHTIFILAVLFVVPDSLPKERQRIAREQHRTRTLDKSTPSESVWARLNPIRLFAPLALLWPALGKPSPLFPSRRGASPALRRNIVLLAAIDASVFSIAMGAVQIIVIYVSFMFHWGSVETSLFASITNGVRIGALFVVLPLILRFFPTRVLDEKTIPGAEKSEVNIIRLSLVFDILGYIGYAVSRHPAAMVASGILSSMGAMASPTLQSALSKHVPHGQVGQLLGTVGLLHALGRVVGPAVLGLLYSETVATFPQAVFVCLAAFLGLVFVASLLIQPYVSYSHEPASDSDTEPDEPTVDEYAPLLSG